MAQLSDMFGGDAGETLLGLPKASAADIAADIVVFGADCATPYPSVGAYCAGGPAAMRKGAAMYAGAHDRYNFDLGHQVLPDGVGGADLGDLDVSEADPEANRAVIGDVARRVLDAGAVPLLLGGDDSVPTPWLQAYAGRGDFNILQIDAHIDWRDTVEGTSWGLSSTMRRASEMAHIGRIVQVGARGIGSAGQAEVDAAKAYGARLIPAHMVHDGGMGQVIDAVPEGEPVIICFDVDALDPPIMPAVIAPTGGGLTHAQVLTLLRGVAARAPIAGVTLVEFKPDADIVGIGARTAGQILATMLGLIARQIADRRA
jgi:agmatinase